MKKPPDEDEGPLRERLREEILDCPWSDLAPHEKRGAVIVVTQELSLLDVAVEVALDRTSNVEKWLGQGKISRPDKALLSRWDRTPDKPFRFLIVQPYVLIQELSH